MRKLKDKRIFIVEDNSMNRVVYKISLGMAGASLQFDQKGDSAISQLEVFKPDLIILDLMLPRGNSGYDLFDQIRNLPDYKNVPIVAISASDPATALLKCQDKGFAGFIAKPIEEELLQDQVLRLINGEPVWYMGERYGGEIGDG